MRSYNPETEDEWDQKYLAGLNAAPWMLEMVLKNPDYPHWGPHEDYMYKRGEEEGPDDLGRVQDHGWESRVLADTWEAFGPWELDDYNECVHFYFEINRDSKQCPVCTGNGYHPDAQWITESFYLHSSPFKSKTKAELDAEQLMMHFGSSIQRNSHGYNKFPDEETLAKYGEGFRQFCEEMRGTGGWGEKSLHPDEIQALQDEGRNTEGMHDGINRSILCEARCKRLGVPCLCPECEGNGSVYIEPEAHLSLILWMLHPRKGASRGVEIKRIEQSELPVVMDWLREAARRNAERFAKIVKG